jgi:hypothetical protein
LEQRLGFASLKEAGFALKFRHNLDHSRTGAGDKINRNLLLLQNLKHTDVRHGAGESTPEGES